MYTHIKHTKDTTWCYANVNDVTKICINLPPSSYGKAWTRFAFETQHYHYPTTVTKMGYLCNSMGMLKPCILWGDVMVIWQYAYIYIHVQCICMCRTACVCPCPCPCLCICICRLVPAPGTIYDGVGGWGGMLTFMWINVHVNLRQQLMLHTRGGGGWGGMLTFMWTCRSSWCYAHAGGWGGMLTFMWTCRSSLCYAHVGGRGG